MSEHASWCAARTYKAGGMTFHHGFVKTTKNIDGVLHVKQVRTACACSKNRAYPYLARINQRARGKRGEE